MYWSLLEAISRDLNRISADESRAAERAAICGRIPLNLYQGEDAVTVTAELPGVAREDVSITVEGGVLHLTAERKPVELGENESAVVREHVYGQLSRRVRLPFPVEAAEISARLQQGVLQVTLPKRADAKPRRIEVMAD